MPDERQSTIAGFLSFCEKHSDVFSHKEAFDVLKKTRQDFRAARGLASNAKVDENSVANISFSRALRIIAQRRQQG